MQDLEVDPSQVHSIEVDPSQVSAPAKPLSWMDQAAQVVKGGWDNLVQTGEGMANMVAHPINSVKGMLTSQDALRIKAEEAFKKGDYVGGLQHVINYAIPMAGPAIDQLGEEAKSGKPGAMAHALGGSVALGLQLAGPGALERTVPPPIAGMPKPSILPAASDLVPKISSALNPVEQSAVDFMRGNDVPLNVGTVTGNRFVKAAQAIAQNQPLGAQTAMKAARATEQGLTRLSGDLADEAYPHPVSPESAGTVTPKALQAKVADLGLAADESYQQAWEGRNDPAHTYDMPVGMEQKPVLDAAGKPTGQMQNVPTMKPVNMPVDVRDIKAAMKPVWDEMQWMPASDRASSAGYQAVKNILQGDDFIPAWQAEKGLGGLKTMARTDTTSGVRNTSQGIGASIIPDLQDSIDAAVGNTGPEALKGLQQGRAFHASKMDVADVADQLREEPVQAFNQMTWQKDTGIDFLRKINEHAPEVMPQVGRAYIQKLFDSATQEGGFGKSRTILSNWQNLGPQTKALLFKNPALRTSLDDFFKGASMVAENPNPSGTAVVGSLIPGGMLAITNPVAGGAWLLGGYAASKLLFSPKGVALLTDGLKIPAGSARGAFTASRILEMAGDDVKPIPPPDEPPPTPPNPEGPAPGSPSTPAGPGGGPKLSPLAKAARDRFDAAQRWQAATPSEQLSGSPQSGIGVDDGSRNQAGGAGPTGAAESNIGRAGAKVDGRGIGEGAQDSGSNQPVGGAGPQTHAEAPGGLRVTVRIPGQPQRYPAQYEVRELADIQSSHSGRTFQPNPKYGIRNDRDYSRGENQGKVINWSSPSEFDPAYLLTESPDASNGAPVIDDAGNVLGGNGRSMILDRVYNGNPQGAAAYKQLLAEKGAQFGLDPESIAAMKRPVLVRRIGEENFTQEGGKQQAVTDFNKTGTAALRGSEKAIADSRRVSEGTLDHIAGRLEAEGQDATLYDVLDKRAGPEVLQRLIDDGVISPQEQAAYVDNGKLTAEGKARVSKLMLGRFFRDPAQLDATPPALRNKLERIAAPLAKTEGRGEWSLAEPIQKAMDLLAEARSHGQKSLDDVVAQSGLFGHERYTPETVALAKALRNVNPNDLTKAVRQYAQDAAEADQGPGLFGPPPTQAESFAAAFSPKGK